MYVPNFEVSGSWRSVYGAHLHTGKHVNTNFYRTPKCIERVEIENSLIFYRKSQSNRQLYVTSNFERIVFFSTNSPAKPTRATALKLLFQTELRAAHSGSVDTARTSDSSRG